MLRQLAGFSLLSIFAWNALLGTTGGIMLCLHSSGNGHLLSDAQADPCCHFSRFHQTTVDGALFPADCSECTDIALQGIRITALRPDESYTAKTAPVVLTEVGLPNSAHRRLVESNSLPSSRPSSEIAPFGVSVKQAVVRLL